MTRPDYIQAVKAKLEEISPFDEPASFIAADPDEQGKIKPIQSYIDSELDRAARYCLNTLPLSLLSKDVTSSDKNASVDEGGVGHIGEMSQYLRLVRVHDNGKVWKRDVTAFMTTSDALYLLQQNVFTRGGVAKPVVVINPEQGELELFSFPPKLGLKTESLKVYYIDGSVVAESVKSDISEYIILVCAAYVAEILQDTNRATTLRTEFQEKVASIII